LTLLLYIVIGQISSCKSLIPTVTIVICVHNVHGSVTSCICWITPERYCCWIFRCRTSEIYLTLTDCFSNGLGFGTIYRQFLFIVYIWYSFYELQWRIWIIAHICKTFCTIIWTLYKVLEHFQIYFVYLYIVSMNIYEIYA
jgi:hypothetical protein